MKLIDTNAILRFLLNDIKEQHDQARDIIKAGAFTTPEVLAEVAYVLGDDVFSFDKKLNKRLVSVSGDDTSEEQGAE